MTHHLLPQIGRDWLKELKNCFLIRDPADVIASYLKKNRDPVLDDLGFVQQEEIFEFVRRETGAVPPVIDARDVQAYPERILRLLCEAVGVEFTEAMLSWPAGLRETDGVWARHWYREVENSTGFRAPKPRQEEVPARLRSVHEQALEVYRRLHQLRLR